MSFIFFLGTYLDHFQDPQEVPGPHFWKCLEGRQTGVYPCTFTLSGARLNAQVHMLSKKLIMQ